MHLPLNALLTHTDLIHKVPCKIWCHSHVTIYNIYQWPDRVRQQPPTEENFMFIMEKPQHFLCQVELVEYHPEQYPHLVALVESLLEQYQSLSPVTHVIHVWVRFCIYFCISILLKIEEILRLSYVITHPSMLFGFVQHHVHPCCSLLEQLHHKRHNDDPIS